MPHTLSYCALIGKCALIRSNTVYALLFVGLRHMVNSHGIGHLYTNDDFSEILGPVVQN